MIFVGLFDDSGREVQARSYLRQPVAAWEDGPGGTLRNREAITFPSATGDWGTIMGFALFETATSPKPLIEGSLDHPLRIGPNDAVMFAQGSLTALGVPLVERLVPPAPPGRSRWERLMEDDDLGGVHGS